MTNSPRSFAGETLLSWSIFGFGLLNLASYGIYSYSAPDYIALWPRLINPLLQAIFVVAAWLLVTRKKLALPLFVFHFLAAFYHVASGAPDLLFTPGMLGRWLFVLCVIAFVAFRWRQRALR